MYFAVSEIEMLRESIRCVFCRMKKILLEGGEGEKNVN